MVIKSRNLHIGVLFRGYRDIYQKNEPYKLSEILFWGKRDGGERNGRNRFLCIIRLFYVHIFEKPKHLKCFLT